MAGRHNLRPLAVSVAGNAEGVRPLLRRLEGMRYRALMFRTAPHLTEWE